MIRPDGAVGNDGQGYGHACNFLTIRQMYGLDMRRLIFILWALLAINLIHCSEPIVELSGIQGNSLLRALANNTTSNATSPATSDNVINLSQLGGEGSTIFENLTSNSSLNRTANSSSSDLSSWGSTPRKAPLPPTVNYDPKRANTIAILRANHGF